MPKHVRETNNAEARQSMAGSRKNGKLKTKQAQSQSQEQQNDPNAEILTPKSKEQKEVDRKEKLKAELIAQSDSKWTSKKKKRLEKYIEKKLKKEERIGILEKLAQTQAEIPSSLLLQSSSTLGTGHVATHQELLEHKEDKDLRRLLDGPRGKRKRDRVGRSSYDEASEISDGTEELDYISRKEDTAHLKPVKIDRDVRVVEDAGVSTIQPLESTSTAEVGSALRRNAHGIVSAPIVRPRKQKKSAFKGWGEQKSRQAAQPENDSDTSFDSSDSAYDSPEYEIKSNQEGAASEEESELDSESFSQAGGSQNEQDETQSLPKRKSLGFKEWALKQINAAKGHTSLTSLETAPKLDSQPSVEPRPPPAKKRKVDSSSKQDWHGPLGEELKLPETSFAKKLLTGASDMDSSKTTMPGDNPMSQKTKGVSVARPPDVQEARLLLPIIAEEQPIMEAILLNPVVIICGETGSGKTTQVPQFLYEAGFGSPGSDNPGMIGITQPRRVAAMSMAARVAHELSLTSSRVSYQIRYDATVSPSTLIKFMTDGVLLRELATDFLLTKYSVIIIDEAHERSMNTDILIGVLSRVIKLREEMWKEGKDNIKPLRLIIMSATLRVSDFAENKMLFTTAPPVINVASRQYPVTVHFNRRTASDYVLEAIKKATKIHTRLPPGGILIFLTGQNEIMGVCRKLESKFGRKAIEERKRRRMTTAIRGWDRNVIGLDNDSNSTAQVAPAHADVEAEDLEFGDVKQEDAVFDVDDDAGAYEEDLEALDSDEERALDEELGLNANEETEVPMYIVPLYSLLPSERQMRVFQPPPPDCRLVVVSTNVAETSLTIPGIRYVVDCGRAKERHYDAASGIQAFRIGWVSKASAAQRAGRAGRVGPGHCYRLYSSALYENHFDKFSQPEILRIPIEGVVLQMKAMHIDSVVNFPFPTPPDRPALRKAETVLTHLGALKTSLVTAPEATSAQITELGKTMALFPLSPRFSRMLVSGQQHGCLPYVVTIVSALSVGDPFLHEEALRNEDDMDDTSSDKDELELDHITSEAVWMKEAHRLRRKAFFQAQVLHASLGNSTSDVLKLLSVIGAFEYAGGSRKFCEEHFVRVKAMEEIHKLRAQISNIVQVNFPGIDAGFKAKLKPPNDLQLKVLRQLLAAAFIDQVAVRKDKVDKAVSSGAQYANTKGVPYRAMNIADDVFIHPSSILTGGPPPEYVVYHEVVQTTRVWLKGLTVINPSWLSSLGRSSLCTFSKPVRNDKGIMMCIPRFGPEAWELSPVKADT
ncbi:hypothetical protein AX17_005296 [Amanita inopinata Kibby_2008]|nr:hypothetical protein AX17_005296 [Amanita inopinata Kibby_2008]